MAKVILNRIDSPEVNDVSLSTGEVSIGRGSILGCDDKRISRNHGLLHVSDNGCITLVSLHSNPCFYKEQSLDAYAVLVKGQSKTLSAGDEFALLPNSFRYRINVVTTAADLGAPMGASSVVPTANGIASADVDNATADSVATTPSKRKRMLPGWLTGLPGNEPSGSEKTDSGSPPAVPPSNPRKRKASTGVEEVTTVVKVEPVVVADKTVVKVEPLDVAGEAVALGSSDGENSTNEAGPSVDVKPSVDKDGYEAEYGDANPTQADPGPSSRQPCVYGATCYRKNPQHRTELSHPGDPDFRLDPGLPECPYGTSCYRKNLQHRKDYKHTNPPVAPSPQADGNSPTTRTRQRPAAKDGDDSEDDYDYNDPFLNDASSDDYQPTSSEDTDMDEDEDEDVESQERKRMLREAKKFTKKKKK